MIRPPLLASRSPISGGLSRPPVSRWALALAAVTLLGTTAVAAPAWACGGFFCNLADPINQAAERVLYISRTNAVTVHIQIQYSGPAAGFSWVLPLPKQPKLGVGSDSIFSALETYTKPQFLLEQQNDEKCHFAQCAMMASAGGGTPNAGTKDSGGGVTILAVEAVGPYDTVVLQGDTGEAVQKWLDSNGFAQPASSKPLLDLYAKKKFVFLALKLQGSKDSKDLQPIVVTVAEPSPCLPIRLTSIAAEPDMPIIGWFLGKNRAIPKNYLHVQLNDKTIDWMSGGANYWTVVSKAADQASGHAFVTEYAGKSSILQGAFAGKQWDAAKLAGLTEPGPFLMAMLNQGIPRTSQLQTLIRKFIPKPKQVEAKTDQEFYNCIQSECGWSGKPGKFKCDPSCEEIKLAAAGQAFDGKAFAAAIDEGVIKPLTEVQADFDAQPYLTRLFTLVSPAEMDKDPIFAWNADLPEVPRERKAKAKPICTDGTANATKAELTFADSTTLTVDVPKEMRTGCFGGGGGFGGGFGATPKDQKGPLVLAGGQPARVVEVLDESGPAYAIDPRVADKVDAELNKAVAGTPSLSDLFKKSLPPVTWNPSVVGNVPGMPAKANTGADAGTTGTDTGSKTTPPVATPPKDSGCSAHADREPPRTWWLLLGLVGGAVLLRRARNRRGEPLPVVPRRA